MSTGQAQSKVKAVLKLPLGHEALSVERLLGLALLSLLAIAAFIILRPFISALLWAVIITYSTSGLYCRFQHWLNGRRSLAAILSTLFVGAVIVLPLVIVSTTLTENVTALAANAREALDRGLGPPPAWVRELPLVGPPLQDHWKTIADGEANFAVTLHPYLSVAGSWLLSALASIGGGILELLLSLVIAFFQRACYARARCRGRHHQERRLWNRRHQSDPGRPVGPGLLGFWYPWRLSFRVSLFFPDHDPSRADPCLAAVKLMAVL
jgi:predicted PurR-regulated permease PerM